VFYTHNFIFEFLVTGCPEIKMRNILKNRTALSTVVTTLIILVVSVLLAGVVTYFAINVTSTRVQEENLILTKQHIWVTGDTNTAEAGIMVTNTGGRDVVLSKIACRGQDTVLTTDAYFVMALKTDDLTDDLQYIPAVNITTTPPGGLTGNLAAVTGNIVLKSGATIVVYITNPDSISVQDVGLTVALTLFSSQAIYYKETNVEAVSLG
jgi:hypothetical protein